MKHQFAKETLLNFEKICKGLLLDYLNKKQVFSFLYEAVKKIVKNILTISYNFIYCALLRKQIINEKISIKLAKVC